MKTKQQYEKYLWSVINEFVPKLFLQKHIIELKSGCDSQDSTFEIDCNYPYFNPTISYSDDSFEKWKKGKSQRDYVVHELCHLISEPLTIKARQRFVSQNEIEHEREVLTEHICNILLNKLK